MLRVMLFVICYKYKLVPKYFLVNGIKLQGQIESFDQFVILLRNTVNQMVYKHAISTVVPSRAVPYGVSIEKDDKELEDK